LERKAVKNNGETFNGETPRPTNSEKAPISTSNTQYNIPFIYAAFLTFTLL